MITYEVVGSYLTLLSFKFFHRLISPINTDSIRFNIQVMIATLSVIIITLLLLLPLCACKKKAKFGKFIDDPKIVPQSRNISEKEIQQMKLENTQSTIILNESPEKMPQKQIKVVAEIQKQTPNLEITKSNQTQTAEETQCSQTESIQNVEEVMQNEKETWEGSKSREVSSHGTLQYVQPRVRFFKRAKEIEQCEPIDKQRHEYRTLMLIDEDKNLITENIHPREVRQQDIIECKIEKYTVVGYQMPEILEEYTCRDDDF
ncbi:hypothetical protein QQG55_45290 [Brugia pahangi]